MRVVLVFGVVGHLLRYFSAAFVPPLALSIFERDVSSSLEFLAAMLVTFTAGTIAGRGFSSAPFLYRGEALAVVALAWLTVAVFAAIPYLFEGLGPVDALFESMSGLTTTGATILPEFESHGDAFFLWRGMTQWFGGLGVIALFIVVLPRLGIAGRQLFFAEASTVTNEAISPRVRDVANRLWILYALLTLALVLSLMACGMTLYESVVHALATLAAGGFSPHPQSIAGYANPAAEWVLVLFMLIGGTSFPLLYRAFAGQPGVLLRDRELLFYLAVAGLGAFGVAFVLAGGFPTLEELRMGAFQCASMISSTGFASTDYNLWPDQARGILIPVMIVGGCAGSAAGGPKAIRILLVFRHVQCELIRVLHPRAIVPLRHEGNPVPDEVMRAVFTLVALFMSGYALSGVVLVFLGLDLVTGFTAALACLGNIGPGFGPAGPMGSYAGFSDVVKLLLTFDMWIGRLEIVTVLALFHPDFWRDVRLRA